MVWGSAAADETEKKLGSPGFRPPSAGADAFVKAVGSAPIAVFPTVVRIIGGETSYDRASQKEIVRLLKDNGLGGGEALDSKLDLGELKGNSQWEAFQAGRDTLGKEVAKAKVQSDYALVVELLIHPDQTKVVAVWGIHCYVLKREGANAFSFLLNSHHKMFVDAALKTQDRSDKGQEKLIAGAVGTALNALKRQVDIARGASTSTSSPAAEVADHSPGQKVFDHYPGNWRQTATSFKSEWTPNETQLSFAASCARILDGRFVEMVLKGPGFPEHLILKTYDAQRDSYRRWDFNANGQTSESIGKWDAAAKTMTWSHTTDDGLTNTITDRHVDADTLEWSMVIKDRSGKVFLHMEGKATRAPSLVGTDVRGQESSAPPPDMKVLERLVGTWQVEHINRVAKWTAKETRATYVTTWKPILGGRFVQRGFDDEVKLANIGIYTYDTDRKAYRRWFFNTEGPVVEEAGTWDESSQTFKFTHRPGAGVTWATTIRFVDDNTYEWSIIATDADGEVGLHMEGKAVRQK